MSTLAQIKKYLGCNNVNRRELVKFVLGRICNKTTVPSSDSLNPTNICFLFNVQHFLKKTDPQHEQCHF
jgi:hypothetical protein